MNKQTLVIALLVIIVGQLHAETRKGNSITPALQDEITATVQVEAVVEIQSDDPKTNKERIRVVVGKGLKDIGKKFSQLQTDFEYIRDNRDELVKRRKYDERRKAFEKKLDALYDSTKGYMSGIGPKTEQFMVKLDGQCRQQDQRIKLIDDDISALAKTQAKAKKKLDSLAVTSSGYVTTKTTYYKGLIRLNTLRAKAASLRVTNAAEQLAVSIYYSVRALHELYAEYRQQQGLQQERDPPMKKK